ncbi:ankyrin repeat, SAM and basic leucine zipper domain-containing protein 1-like isoform X1 [Macrobrachium rosenbergii]|uniref:ankyrin repeat, SAM and basic leucine zipper domain-containing protein 1-like isoform X1 n=1 Tax=Macrobrachium rosenbergii TaxID=79674 RepID=UPI0034D767B1
MFAPAGMSESSEEGEFELESSVGGPERFRPKRPREEVIDMTPISKQDESANPTDSGFFNSDSAPQSLGSIMQTSMQSSGSSLNDFVDRPDAYVNGYSNTLYPGYSNGYLKASSPTPSWGSRKSRSPAPSLTGSWRQRRMHEGYSQPLDEFRMAGMQGNLPVIKSLVQQGIAVDQILKSGWTCLMYACSCAKPHVVQYLLQQNADPNLHKELFTALMAACASSRESETDLLECVELLLSYGALVNTAERHRMTALMFASKEGRSTIVQRLIEAKVDVNKQDNKGWTALCWAATKGHGKVVRILLQHSADPTKMNNHGQRASDIALAAGYPEIADILDRVIDKGTDAKDSLSILDALPDATLPKSPNGSKDAIIYGELEMVLCGLELKDLIPLFHKHKVSFESFLRFTEKDLENMNIDAVGVRKKILHAIKEIHKKDWQTSSLPDLTQSTMITVPEAVAMIGNINKHIRYMHASVGYLRDQIQANPRLLQLGQEVHSVSSLASNCGDSLKYTQGLFEELKFFKNYLDKVSGNAEYSPADLIVDCTDNGKVWQRRILASLIATTAVATVLWYSRPRMFAKVFNITIMPDDVVTLDV